jgi:hypothetical protein
MSMEAQRERGRLFQRPEKPRAVRITFRDIALMTNIARLRLASAAQLAALDGGSQQNVARCLLTLWENKYLERPVAQIDSRKRENGSRSTIYGLTRKGAAFLRRQGFDMNRRLLDGIDSEKGAGWRFIEHSIGISEFFVQLELAARKRKDLRILERCEILEDAPKGRNTRRIRLEASIRLGGTQKKNAVIPDGFFGLRFLNEEQESYFMYEKDRGEMPIERRKNLQGTYIAKKLLTYYEASRQRVHVHELGIPNFRVLVETTTPDRVEQMLEVLGDITDGKGSNIFLFIDERALAESDPLAANWISGKGSRIRIID